MNKIAVFFRKYGHKILTFCIGLAFLGGCVFLLWLGGDRIYHMFKPEHIYEQGVDPDLIADGAAFDELRSSGLKEGSKEYFEEYISSFVKQDFPGFTDPLELNTDYFVSYGIWQAIKVNAQGVYVTDEKGIIRIPKADVEKYARYNFNYVGDIKHHSVETGGGFEYEKLSGCYKVSSAMGNTFLVPNVLDVAEDKETGEVTLLVDLYYNDGLTAEDITQDASKFAKRITITMQKIDATVVVDDAEMLVTDYLYTSCALVDETVSGDTLPGNDQSEEKEESEESEED